MLNIQIFNTHCWIIIVKVPGWAENNPTPVTTIQNPGYSIVANNSSDSPHCRKARPCIT